MTWEKAITYLKDGKCKGVTRMDLPSMHYITLFKYTRTWYFYDKGFTVNKPSHHPEDIIMYCGDTLDSPGRYVNLGMWADDKWLITERVWDETEMH